MQGQIYIDGEVALDPEDASVYFLRKYNGRIELFGAEDNIAGLVAKPEDEQIVLPFVGETYVDYEVIKTTIKRGSDQIGEFTMDGIMKKGIITPDKDEDGFFDVNSLGEYIILTAKRNATDMLGVLLNKVQGDENQLGLDDEDSTVYLARKHNENVVQLFGSKDNIAGLLVKPKGVPIVLPRVEVNVKFDDLKKKINKAKNEIGVFSRAEIFGS